MYVESNLQRSFNQGDRIDLSGKKITKGGDHKIKFADEAPDDRKKSLTKTYIVESYKKYNSPTWMEKWWIIF